VTPSTTNTAAREFYRCVECKRFGYAETPCVKCGGITTPPTLTQQQGGEQEAHIETLRAMREPGGCVDDDAWISAVDAAIAALAPTP